MDEAHVELLARHLERVAPTLREGRRELEHVVVRLRRLETYLLTKVAPAERLLLHLEAGELALELRDAGVLDRLDGLGLDLGVPDLELPDLLPERSRRAREHRGAGGRRDASGQEAAAGYVTRMAAGR